MAAQNNAPLPEGLEIAGYRIVKKIASGGFSIVYLAYDAEGSAVAIKEYLPSALALRQPGELAPIIARPNQPLFRIGLKCFFEEGRALARINHPNVVRIVNFFRANDTVYMVMAYESGQSLQEHIARTGKRTAQRQPPRRRIHPQDLRRRLPRPARNPRQQAAAPGPETGQHLFTQRRLADPARLRRGAPGGRAGRAHARAHVHAGLRAARPVHQGTGARSLVRHLQPGCGHVRLHDGCAAAGGRCASNSTTSCGAQFDKLAGAYSPELIAMVRACLALDPMARPQSVFAVQKVLQTAPVQPLAAEPAGDGAARRRTARPARAHRRPQARRLATHSQGITPCSFPSTSTVTSAGARSTRTGWATASRATRCCWCWPTAWAATSTARSPPPSPCRPCR